MIINVKCHKWKKCLQDLHRLIGSTVLLNTRVGARGAEGAGYGAVLFPEFRHILQQQNSRSKLMTAPPIMAPGVVNVQWSKVFSLASLVIISSSLIRISASNLLEIFVRSLSIAAMTFSFSGCWKSCPKVQVQSSHF
jgi:hypothetical protein